MAMEHTTVHATVHTRETTAKKVRIKFRSLNLLFSVKIFAYFVPREFELGGMIYTMLQGQVGQWQAGPDNHPETPTKDQLLSSNR